MKSVGRASRGARGGAGNWGNNFALDQQVDRVVDSNRADEAGRLDSILARSTVDQADGVQIAPLLTAGADALATVAGRGRAHDAAVAQFEAFTDASGEIPPFVGDFGEFSDALARACASCEGDLGEVLADYLALCRHVAAGIGRISSG